MELEAYTDADYAGSLTDRRSTSGYCTFLGGNLVTWRSKKQPVVARSSSEAEFRLMAQGICELLWLKIILKDLKIKLETPMKLYCDNKSAINIAHNPVQHDKTKHVEVDRHFIKEKLESRLICTPYISTEGQLADILSEGLANKEFQNFPRYGRYRPPWSPLSKRLKGWQTLWWHYAQQSVLSDVRKSLRKTSWKYLGER
ncbi:hypothetical protein RJ640_025451, partial [Escallonia rubra]